MPRQLTLSFDNGPDSNVTPAVLDVLARRGIKTSFFVVGQRLLEDANHKLAQRAHAEGHWIGNHTFTHKTPFGELASDDEARAEIDRTQQAIGALASKEKLFRPFGAGGNLDRRLLSKAVVKHLVAEGFTCVLWNAIPRDWADPDGWVDRALDQCRENDWTLMVLHDLPTGAMRHLDFFLDRVVAVGIEIRQAFPPACLPIRSGRIVLPLEALVGP